MTDVRQVLADLRDGKITVAEAALDFGSRKWPPSRPAAKDGAELIARDHEDPEPMVPGSFDEVSAAYARGDLTSAQYAALALAAAAGMQGPPGTGTGTGTGAGTGTGPGPGAAGG